MPGPTSRPCRTSAPLPASPRSACCPPHLHQQLAAVALDACGVHITVSHQDLDLRGEPWARAPAGRQQVRCKQAAVEGQAGCRGRLCSTSTQSSSQPQPGPALTGERQWMPARLRTAISRPIMSLQERSWGSRREGQQGGVHQAADRLAATPTAACWFTQLAQTSRCTLAHPTSPAWALVLTSRWSQNTQGVPGCVRM